MKKIILMLFVLCIVGCSGSQKDSNNPNQMNLRIGWKQTSQAEQLNKIIVKGLVLNYNDIFTYAANEHTSSVHELYLEGYDDAGMPVVLEPTKISWTCETDQNALYSAQENKIWYMAKTPGEHVITATYEGQVANLNAKVYNMATLVYLNDDPTPVGFDLDNAEITYEDEFKDIYVVNKSIAHCPYGVTVINPQSTIATIQDFHNYIFNEADIASMETTVPISTLCDLLIVKTKSNKLFKVKILGALYFPGVSFKVPFIYDELTTQ